MDILILPDGSQVTAISSVRLTRRVNAEEDICPGSACAALLEVSVFTGSSPEITQGMELTYRHNGTDMGIFLCEKPRRTGANTCAVTAYDRMIRFDREVSGLLEDLSPPVTAQKLLEQLCAYCGVTPVSGTRLPGGDLEIPAFSGSGITGRQLLNWLGQVSGRYFTVTAAGLLQAAWYTKGQTLLGDTCPYRLGSLTYADYATAPVERLVIRAGEKDVGAVWPDGSQTQGNTLIIEGNPLLTAQDSAQLQTVAQRLYQQLEGFRYTPFSCTLLAGAWPSPGEILSFPDGKGGQLTGIVMQWKLENGVCTVSATGNPSLSSTTAFNRLTLSGLQGKVLRIEQGVEGLKVENADNAGAVAQLGLTVEGIAARVSAVEETSDGDTVHRLTQLEQKADGLELSVTQTREALEGKAEAETVQPIAERFLFREDGLTILNSATGMGIGISQERIVFTGGEDPTTAITPNEMETTNLRVGSSLAVGDFSLIPRSSGNLSLRWTGRTI